MKKAISNFLFFIYTLGLIVIIFTISFSFGNQRGLNNLFDDGNYSDSTVKEVDTASGHSSAVINDGTSDYLYTWGSNSDGQLGLGEDKDIQYNTPQKVAGLPNGEIKQVALGDNFSEVIVNDGTRDHLYAWGNNSHGQLGLGNEESKSIPIEVTNLPKGEIKQIALGKAHSVAIINDGTKDTVYTWGSNTQGQLGLGNKESKSIPTKVTALPEGEIKQISSANESTFVILNNGTGDFVYSWGSNSWGQLGIDDMWSQSFDKPKKIKDLPTGTIKQISASENNCSAIVNNVLYAWGSNTQGQLGINSQTKEEFKPFKVVGLPTGEIRQVSMKRDSTFVNVNNTLYGFGSNKNGQLGLGEGSQGKYKMPEEIISLPKGEIKQIAFGDSKNSFITMTIDGVDNIYTSGLNDHGQLGIGSDENQKKFSLLFPHYISGLTNFAIVGGIRGSYIDVSVDAEDISSTSEYVSNFSLELIDSSDNKISGSSTTKDFNSCGTKTFTITGLTPRTDYGLVKLRVVDTNIESNDVELETTKEPTGLEDAKIIDNKKETSVKISVNVVYVPSQNEDIYNYDLEVVQGSNVIGNSSAINIDSDGIQIFNLTELDSDKEYTNVFVRIVNTTITSNTFSFKTKDKKTFPLIMVISTSIIIIIILTLIFVIALVIYKKRKNSYDSYGGGNNSLRGEW